VALEKWLATLEGKAKPVFDQLDRRVDIEPEDRFFLSVFLGVLYCRNPRHEREMNELLTGESRTILRRNLIDPVASKNFTSGTPEELLSYVESDKFSLKFDHNYVLAGMIEAGKRLGQEIFTSDWEVLHAISSSNFASCDVPFGILSKPIENRPVGIASPEATKSVPLSARTCLLLSGAGGTFRRRKAKEGEIRRINIATLRETEMFAIAQDEAQLVRLVESCGLRNLLPETKMVVDDLPDPSGDRTRSISVFRRAQRNPPRPNSR